MTKIEADNINTFDAEPTTRLCLRLRMQVSTSLHHCGGNTQVMRGHARPPPEEDFTRG